MLPNRKIQTQREKNEVQLSKQLSWLLRHGAQEMNLPLKPDGFVPVNAILQHPRYSSSYSLELLQKIVETDKKQRFTLRRDTDIGEFEIRANQGHSLTNVRSEECLHLISNAKEVPLAVHGTYYKSWNNISREGLRRMGRNHVHFATSDVITQPISGFRANCQVLIYLDVQKILEEKIMPLYRSSNNVILCPGIEPEGVIPTKYFSKVVDRRTGKNLEILKV